MPKKVLTIIGPPCTYVRTFSVHDLRENCHFLNHLSTYPTLCSYVIVKWAPIVYLVSHDFCQFYRMLQRLASVELKQAIAKNLWSEITKPLVGEIH